MIGCNYNPKAKNCTDEAIQLFDQIFCNISPVDSLVLDRSLNEVHIPASILNEKQCDAIKHLSGYLALSKQYYDNLDMKIANRNYSLVDDKILSDNTEPTSTELVEQNKRMEKTISILQDFLVMELNRSELFEIKVKEKEAECVNLLDTIADLKKKMLRFENQNLPKKSLRINESSVKSTSVESHSSVQTAPIIKIEPTIYIHSFIRKQFSGTLFFGLIVQYDHPYYKIVYEDADHEDLTNIEVKRLLWCDKVPTAKVNQCKKHSMELGYDLSDVLLIPNFDESNDKKRKQSNVHDDSFDDEVEDAEVLEPLPTLDLASMSSDDPRIESIKVVDGCSDTSSQFNNSTSLSSSTPDQFQPLTKIDLRNTDPIRKISTSPWKETRPDSSRSSAIIANLCMQTSNSSTRRTKQRINRHTHVNGWKSQLKVKSFINKPSEIQQQIIEINLCD